MKPPRSMAERLTEADLLRTYQRPYQVARPCACGHVVLADPDNPAAGVTEHRETARHRAWAEEWLA